MIHNIEVAVNHSSVYPIVIGEDLWGQAADFLRSEFHSRKALLAVDENVDRHHGKTIRQKMESVFDEVPVFVLAEGEKSKSMETLSKLLDFALGHRVERGTPLLAFGGGVTGDVSGFAAASVLRGIPLIHFPTTVLAMVDSAIGGKTGINHSAGKNLIGAFYQPEAVFAHTHFLQTLPEREWINGFAEILKYAAIHDPSIFDQVRPLVENKSFHSAQWSTVIHRSASIKVKIVQEDMMESGKRAFLNFGHTFAHALEKEAGYGDFSHGEAVFAGMIAASYASKKMGFPVDSARFDPFKPLYKITLRSYAEKIPRLLDAMRSDKKVKDGKLRLILLKNWGEPIIKECTEALICEAWEYAIKQFDA